MIKLLLYYKVIKNFVTFLSRNIHRTLHIGYADTDEKTRCSIVYRFLSRRSRALLRNCNSEHNQIANQGFQDSYGCTDKEVITIEVRCSSCSFFRPRTRREKTWIVTWNEKKISCRVNENQGTDASCFRIFRKINHCGWCHWLLTCNRTQDMRGRLRDLSAF